MYTLEIQYRLQKLGFDPGVIDGLMGEKTRDAVRRFQTNRKITVDGRPGGMTQAALRQADPHFEMPVSEVPTTADHIDHSASDTIENPTAYQPKRVKFVPDEWMPECRMDRIIVHWSAGPHQATHLDREHYHIIIQGDGSLVRGDCPISGNAKQQVGARASHTLNCNTGSIGVSLACMAGAVESPFDPGSQPMTRAQWAKLPMVLAELCSRYKIPVLINTVLSHAEVQDTLGIKQRGKWDISRLAFDPSVVGAKKCGDIFRTATLQYL